MRITRYTTELTDDKITAVVKENSSNYEISNLNCPENIVRMMNDVFHAGRKAEAMLPSWDRAKCSSVYAS